MNPDDLHALRDGTLERREEHLYRLIERVRDDGDGSAADALRSLVRDYDRYHRSLYTRAMNQAGVFCDDSLAQPLLAALTDTRYNCQAWAAMGCGVLRLRAAVPHLVDLLDHPQWIARQEAVHALGRIGDDRVVPALAPLLRDPADWMRQAAADALARIGGDAALEALWAELVGRAFPRIGYIASALATFGPKILPRLVETADSPDPDQRYWVAVALGSTGDERAAPTLERLLAGDRGTTVFDGEVRVAAKKGLRTLRRIQAAVAARS